MRPAEKPCPRWKRRRPRGRSPGSDAHEKKRPLYPKAVQIASADVDPFLTLMDQPREIWTTLRSTNLIERFNRELRRRLRSAGALPSENSVFKLVGSVSMEQENRWAKRKAFRVKKTAPKGGLLPHTA